MSSQCQGQTRSGSQCLRSPLDKDNHYCWQHGGGSDDAPTYVGWVGQKLFKNRLGKSHKVTAKTPRLAMLYLIEDYNRRFGQDVAGCFVIAQITTQLGQPSQLISQEIYLGYGSVGGVHFSHLKDNVDVTTISKAFKSKSDLPMTYVTSLCQYVRSQR